MPNREQKTACLSSLVFPAANPFYLPVNSLTRFAVILSAQKSEVRLNDSERDDGDGETIDWITGRDDDDDERMQGQETAVVRQVDDNGRFTRTAGVHGMTT